MMFKKTFKITKAVVAVLAGGMVSNSIICAQGINHGVAAANITVVQNDLENNTSSVTVTTPLSINQFAIRDGSNRGDYNVQAGSSFNDDMASGIMIASISENGRNNIGETNNPGVNYCTPALGYSLTGANAGAYYISSFNAPTGAEFNMNMAAAFFPYTNWLAGLVRNSGGTNAGANNLLTGSPGLVLGTHFVDNGGGISTVNLTSRGINSQTDGVLLVMHGKNEDNYALSQVNTNGTWTVYIKDNGSNADAYEQDPVAFVFIPKTNTTVISGRFRTDSTILLFSGTTPRFGVTNIGVGKWRLTIPGHSPASGVLITSPEGGFPYNQDNMVTYQADGDGWIIQSRDLPGNPPGLQTPATVTEAIASFVFIPATTTVTVISPTNDAQSVVTTAPLQVGVTNIASGNMTVKFYGRVAPTNPTEDFCIAILPDTQYYTAERYGGTKEMFYAQTEWIISHRISDNIAYVAHMGDISDSGDIKGSGANTTEWRNATNAMYRLENPLTTLLSTGIPYGVAVGNHDSEPNGDADGTTTFYNQYFGISHFAGKPYYAGHYGTNSDNHFDFFSAGGLDFVVIYFEYDTNATPAVLSWANEVLRTNANRRAIIVTHNFGNTSTPLKFSSQGAAIYNALKAKTNVFLMLAGHVTGEGSREDTFNGNTIRTFVQDFQGWTNGGDGFMRLLYFSPTNNQVVGQTYSPWTGEYETDANSEFFFTYNMQQPQGSTNETPFVLLGSVSNLTSGSVASVVWSNRQVNMVYQWYAVVTDASNNVMTGPLSRFITAPNSPPVTSNRVVTVTGDIPSTLTLTASDVNADQLTYQLKSSPTRGLIQNFDPAGTFLYTPTRGFRGQDRFTYQASDGLASSSVVTLNINVVAPSDTNANGLPDAWETTYGVINPDADNDGDGQNNLDEYVAGTNPTNAASLLRVGTATRATNGFVTLTWPSVGGTRYRVQYNNGGTNGSFDAVFTDITRALNVEMDSAPYNATSTQTFVDDFTLTGGGITNRARYYRIKIVP